MKKMRKADVMTEPKDILKKWMDSINTADTEGVLHLYNENAILIPTFSNRVLNNHAKIRDYFERLRTYNELSVALHEKTLSIQRLGGDKFALCGIYCWRFIVEEELLSFEARFSFFADMSLAHPVLHHHSSQIPRVI